MMVKKFLFLSSLFFVNAIFCAERFPAGSLVARDKEDRTIIVENNGIRVISIAYRDAGSSCLMIEKIKPHHRLQLVSSTPFLCIQQEKFFLKNKRHHFFIERSKTDPVNEFQIFDYSSFFALK